MNSEALNQLIKDYFTPAVPGRTIHTLIETIGDPDNRVQALSPVLQNNPMYSDFILKMDMLSDRVGRWINDDGIDANATAELLEKALALLGRNSIRNACLCMKVFRASKSGLPRKKSDKLQLAPREIIKTAIMTEEFCDKLKLAMSYHAFLAGLHFDMLRALALSNKVSGDIKVYIDNVVKRALKAALIAYNLGATAANSKFDAEVFAATMLSWTGRILQYILAPKDLDTKSWFKFEERTEMLGDEADIAFRIREKTRFEWTHPELGAMWTVYCRIFSPIEKSIAYYQEPYLLKGKSHDLYDLASLIHISNRLSRVEDMKLFKFNDKQLQLLKDLKLKETVVRGVVERVISQYKEGMAT